MERTNNGKRVVPIRIMNDVDGKRVLTISSKCASNALAL